MGTSVVRFKNAEGSASRWGVLRGADIFPLNLDIADHRGLMRQYFNDRTGFDTDISQGSVPMSDVLEARSVAEEDLESLIGALVLANDVSARDFMFGAPAMQWFKGKSQ